MSGELGNAGLVGHVAAGEGVFETVWPSGRSAGLATGLAPRLRSLDGARIAFVWDHVFRGDEMFSALEAHSGSYAAAAFITHTAFGDIHGNPQEEMEAIALLPERLLEHRIDAVVVGVGA